MLSEIHRKLEQALPAVVWVKDPQKAPVCLTKVPSGCWLGKPGEGLHTVGIRFPLQPRGRRAAAAVFLDGSGDLRIPLLPLPPALSLQPSLLPHSLHSLAVFKHEVGQVDQQRRGVALGCRQMLQLVADVRSAVADEDHVDEPGTVRVLWVHRGELS